jgi:hypothetical protein
VGHGLTLADVWRNGAASVYNWRLPRDLTLPLD